MPAPSLERLFDMHANIEAAVSAYLTANGLASYATRSTENLPDARIIVHAEIGAAQGHQVPATITRTGEEEQDWFSVAFNFHVQTDRAISTTSPDASFASLHDYWCARLKALMLRGAINGTISGITALSLPYYRLATLAYSAEQYSASDEALDVTQLSYAAQLQIRADAWPV